MKVLVANVTTNGGAYLHLVATASKISIKSINRATLIIMNQPKAESHKPHWYVAIVRSCCERKVKDALSILFDLESWVAVQLEEHQWSDRMKKVERVVLPNYVFFRYSKADEKLKLSQIPPFSDVQQQPNVYGLLTMPGSKEPAVIPTYQYDRFRKMLEEANSKIEVVTDCAIQLGDHVKVVKGKFRGLDGYVSKEPNKRNKIYVAIDFLGYASMEIDADMVKPLKTGVSEIGSRV